MGEGGTTPFAATMTVLALPAVTSGMLVIVLVAVIAGGTQFDAVQFTGMTGVAPYAGVGAGQLELRIPIVIEDELFPFLLVVALSALLAIAPRVNVIDAVASYAFRRDVFIALIGMAAVATRILVLAV